MAVYIKGMGNISPQQSWNDETVLIQALDYRGTQVTCVEPNYAEWIEPKHLRRMSRIIKMGVTAALMALKEANIVKPDAIITGTGYGCLEDTGIFLTKMTELQEEALNPTPFIQSTHNTIGSQIALLLQCQEYNQTYAHGAFSFESALIDAMLQLAEIPDRSVLVGGVDEITPISHLIQSRFGILRRKLASSLNLFKLPKKGTVNGEGAAYFVLQGQRDRLSQATIEAVHTLYKPSAQALRDGIEVFIREAGLRPAEVDLVLLGKSGDKASDLALDALCKAIFPTSGVGLFKHLCGEYPVASAFALWLATRILMERHMPEVVVYKEANRPIRRVLIYNPYLNTHHSLILVKSCRDII